jgi:hypothetical protein
VEQGMDLRFAAVLVPEQSINEPADELSDWSKGRSESISTDNAVAANISDDPTSAANLGLGPGGPATLTYFPLLGLAPSGLGLSSLYSSFSNPYSPFGLYQPGFNSIYLPGYTYQPFIFGLWMGGQRGLPYSPGLRISPTLGTPFPGSIRPHVPLPRPAPIPPAPHPVGGLHPGAVVHPIHR